MNRHTRYFIFFFAILLFFFVVPFAAEAVGFPYWGTNPPILPCGYSGGPPCTDLCQMVQLGQNVVFFGMTLVVFALAPIFIAWGGIELMIGASSLVDIGGGSKEKVSHGKKTIKSAIVGLVLALGAFVIVNTFITFLGISIGGAGGWASFQCTVLELPPPPAPIVPPGGITPPPGVSLGTGWSGAVIPPGTLDDATARNQLRAAGIEVTSSNGSNSNCTSAGQTNCTSLSGLPQLAVDNLIALKSDCKCALTVTAGTEAGHATHGMGKSIVDVRADNKVTSYLQNEIRAANPHISAILPDTYYSIGNERYRYEPPDKPGEGPHWHVEF
ncbi:MAG: pilin [Patescibacteria group bacterium]